MGLANEKCVVIGKQIQAILIAELKLRCFPLSLHLFDYYNRGKDSIVLSDALHFRLMS